MFKRHRTAIVVFIFLFLIVAISGFNLYFLLENINTREDRVRKSVEQVLESVAKEEKIMLPKAIATPYIPVKGVDFFDGKNGAAGASGINGTNGRNGVDGTDGTNGLDGRDGNNGLNIEIRCNTKKNRWETRYAGDLTWQIMNNEVVKCTIDKENEDVEAN